MAIRPTIVQTSLDLSIIPVEDSAGGFPGNLEGANKSIIIGDSASCLLYTSPSPRDRG